MVFPLGFFQMFGQSTATDGSNSREDTVLPCLRELVVSLCGEIEWSAIPLVLVDQSLRRISIDWPSHEVDRIVEIDVLTEILGRLGVKVRFEEDIILLSRRFHGLWKRYISMV